MGLGVGRVRIPDQKRFGKTVVASHVTLVEVPTAAGHLSDADQIAVVQAHVKPLEPKGIRETKTGDQAAVGGERVAGRHKHAVRAHAVVLRVVGERIGDKLGSLVPRQALPLVGAAVLDMGLFQAPRLPLHGIQHAVEVVHAVRMAKTTHTDSLVSGIRKILIRSYVYHFAFANRGNHRTIALAVATADANDLMLLVARSLLIGCSKSRHRGSAHCSGSGYSSCSFEKASARNAFDRYVQFRHFSSYLQMQRNLSALHSGAMHKRPPSRGVGPSPLSVRSINPLLLCRNTL